MKVEFKDVIVGKDGGSNSNLLSFHNMMISLGTYVLFREKRKLKFEHIFETFVEEVNPFSTGTWATLYKVYGIFRILYGTG